MSEVTLNSTVVMAERSENESLDRNARKDAQLRNILFKEEVRSVTRKIGAILKKPVHERSEADVEFLLRTPVLVEDVRQRMSRREIQKQRLNEFEDSPEMVDVKCQMLVDAMKHAEHTIVYTGAGISTAAAIPDYRGPKGVWTLLQKGQEVKTKSLINAEPTFTHMALMTLHEYGYVNYVVSQNCDGLHIRSGLPRKILSEVHGNMYIEVCTNCSPPREYIRLSDVTESTSFRRHKSGNYCDACQGELRDTIVHFGEKGKLESPLQWKRAASAADKSDLIICLGSSLKVLRKYHCLWAVNRPAKLKPKLFIVNLQWTQKDESATLKINGKCDDVMRRVMKYLDIDTPEYKKSLDPIFELATTLKMDKDDDNKTKKRLYKPSDEGSLYGNGLNYAKICDNICEDDKRKISILGSGDQAIDDTTGIKRSIDETDDSNDDNLHDDLITPGWFGKGYSKARLKRKKN